MKIIRDKDNIFDYFTDGSSCLFIKFLYEHKPIIYDMIVEKPKTNSLKKFIRELRRLVEFDFTQEEYEIGLPKEYLSNIVYEIVLFKYRNIRDMDLFKIMEKNMSKEYLMEHFEMWWYQSLYMIGGAGYMRDMNDYLRKYWETQEFFTEDELKRRKLETYNKKNIPKIFTEEEFDIFINGYDPYYPPNIFIDKKTEDHIVRYDDGSRMF